VAPPPAEPEIPPSDQREPPTESVWAPEPRPLEKPDEKISRPSFLESLTDIALIRKRPRAQDLGRMAPIEAGRFSYGSNEGRPDERPARMIHLEAYYIDVFPVTNRLYWDFVRDTGAAEPPHWEELLAQSGQSRADLPFPESYASHPVVYVTWTEAAAFAAWAGKRLPTEAEWEKAARGRPGFFYGYGSNSFLPQGANVGHLKSGTTPVEAYRNPNHYGVYDMTGNVWEWCADWYDARYYQHSPDRNPKGPPSGKRRVLRGGCWVSSEAYARCTDRTAEAPDCRSPYVGFRCARDT
jgi:formylglycine-generating enzyme required for sulfatase activity